MSDILTSFLEINNVSESDIFRAINDRPKEVLAVFTRPILLEHVRTVDVPAAARFVVAEVFTRKNGFWLSEEAKKQLLPIVGESVPAGKIRINRLTRGSVDGPIKAELGDRAEISIVQFVGALQLGHEVIGNWVIAYLEELQDCTVFAYWNGGEWDLFVCPVTDPGVWDSGFHVLSGDSVSESL